MKLVAVTPFVGLASAAFIYTIADDSCNICSRVQNLTANVQNLTADAVSACLALYDRSCEWTVVAAWDLSPLPPFNETCQTVQTQIFRFPEDLDHNLTFREEIEVQFQVAAAGVKIWFDAATKACTLDSYVALLTDPPACDDALDGWTNLNVTLETDAAARFSWDPELKELANYVRFVPRAEGCWADPETEFLKANATNVDGYVIIATHLGVTDTTTTRLVSSDPPTTTESVRSLIASLSGLFLAGCLWF